MSVHYKFKSAISYDTIAFDGLHISVRDLKKAILHQKQIGKSTDFDLQITNAQSNEVYTDEGALIPKNSSLIVVRIPLTAQQKKAWEKSDATQLQLIGLNKGTSDSPDHILNKIAKSADLTSIDASEEDKIQAAIAQSTLDYDPSNYVRIKGSNQVGEIPPNYRCYKCMQPGHWIKDCKLNIQQDASSIEIRKSTGIPRSFMVPVEGPEVPGAMMTPTGQFAVPTIDHEARKEMPKKGSEAVIVEKPSIPEDLLCGVCKDLLTDAVMIPCCGNSFCDECIRNVLLESEDHQCPDCKEKDVSPDTLIPNRFLRNSVNNFKNQTGYSRIVPVKPPPAPPQAKKSVETAVADSTESEPIVVESTEDSCVPEVIPLEKDPSHSQPPPSDSSLPETIEVKDDGDDSPVAGSAIPRLGSSPPTGNPIPSYPTTGLPIRTLASVYPIRHIPSTNSNFLPQGDEHPQHQYPREMRDHHYNRGRGRGERRAGTPTIDEHGSRGGYHNIQSLGVPRPLLPQGHPPQPPPPHIHFSQSGGYIFQPAYYEDTGRYQNRGSHHYHGRSRSRPSYRQHPPQPPPPAVINSPPNGTLPPGSFEVDVMFQKFMKDKDSRDKEKQRSRSYSRSYSRTPSPRSSRAWSRSPRRSRSRNRSLLRSPKARSPKLRSPKTRSPKRSPKRASKPRSPKQRLRRSRSKTRRSRSLSRSKSRSPTTYNKRKSRSRSRSTFTISRSRSKSNPSVGRRSPAARRRNDYRVCSPAPPGISPVRHASSPHRYYPSRTKGETSSSRSANYKVGSRGTSAHYSSRSSHDYYAAHQEYARFGDQRYDSSRYPPRDRNYSKRYEENEDYSKVTGKDWERIRDREIEQREREKQFESYTVETSVDSGRDSRHRRKVTHIHHEPTTSEHLIDVKERERLEWDKEKIDREKSEKKEIIEESEEKNVDGSKIDNSSDKEKSPDRKVKEKKKKKREESEKKKKKRKLKDKTDKKDDEEEFLSENVDQPEPVKEKVRNVPLCKPDNLYEDIDADVDMKPFENMGKSMNPSPPNTSTTAEADSSTAKDVMLAPVPELSKWEKDDDVQIVPLDVKSYESTSKEMIVDESKHVTSEVLKRAENAIFKKSVNPFKQTEKKREHGSERKKESEKKERVLNKEPIVVENYSKETKPVKSVALPVKLDREIEVTRENRHGSDRHKKAERIVVHDKEKPRISAKERLGAKIDDKLYIKREVLLNNKGEIKIEKVPKVKEVKEVVTKIIHRDRRDVRDRKVSVTKKDEEKKIERSSDKKKSVMENTNFIPDYEISDDEIKEMSVEKKREIIPSGKKRSSSEEKVVVTKKHKASVAPESSGESSDESVESVKKSKKKKKKSKKKKKKKSKSKHDSSSDYSDSSSSTSASDSDDNKKKRKHKHKSHKKSKKRKKSRK